MRPLLVITATAAALTLVAGPAVAQGIDGAVTTSRGSFAVTPFGGVLLSQRFLDGPLGTSLNVAGAGMYGIQLNVPLASSVSLIGSVGHASGDLEAGIPIIGGVSLGSTSTTVFDGGVELRFPSRAARAVPFVQFGGGATRREVTVAGVSATTTDFQVSGGIGADIPVSSNIALRIMAKDHYGKADFGGIGELSARTDDLHAVALTGGIRIAF